MAEVPVVRAGDVGGAGDIAVVRGSVVDGVRLGGVIRVTGDDRAAVCGAVGRVGTVTVSPGGVAGCPDEYDAVAALLAPAPVGELLDVAGTLANGAVHPASRPAAASIAAAARRRYP